MYLGIPGKEINRPAIHADSYSSLLAASTVSLGLLPLLFDFLVPEVLSPGAGISPHEILGVPLLIGMHHLLGRPEPGRMVMTSGTGFSFRYFIYFSTSLQSSMNSAASGEVDILCSANGYRLYPLVSHDGADSESAGARPGLLDGSGKDPILSGQADSRHLGFGSFNSFRMSSCGFDSAFALQMRGVTYFHFVIVYPYIDPARGTCRERSLCHNRHTSIPAPKIPPSSNMPSTRSGEKWR